MARGGKNEKNNSIMHDTGINNHGFWMRKQR